MIKHTVFFKLHHPTGSEAESAFLKAAMTLAAVPGVRDLECVRQVGTKNDFSFGLVMGFDDSAAYASYNAHPDHTRFVAERWLPDVAAFLEIDYVAHPLG